MFRVYCTTNQLNQFDLGMIDNLTYRNYVLVFGWLKYLFSLSEPGFTITVGLVFTLKSVKPSSLNALRVLSLFFRPEYLFQVCLIEVIVWYRNRNNNGKERIKLF
jgi:hypothetical protein